MPNLSFPATDFDLAARSAAPRPTRRVFHPRHNWFLSAAHTDRDVDAALTATEPAFAVVAAAVSTR